MDYIVSDRKTNGQFKKGRSGNIKGRPLLESTKIRQQLSCNSNEIIEVIRKAALGGDMQACKMIIDRICPPLKAQAAPVVIKMPHNGDMMLIAEALLKATAKGELAPDIAAQMVAAVGKLATIAKIKEDLPKPKDNVIFDKIQIQVVDSKGQIMDEFAPA